MTRYPALPPPPVVPTNPFAVEFLKQTAGCPPWKVGKAMLRAFTALHEAGHALMCYLQGLVVLEIYNTRGRRVPDGYVWPGDKRTNDFKANMCAEARIYLGGPAVEWILWGTIKGASHDVREAQEKLTQPGAYRRREARHLVRTLFDEVVDKLKSRFKSLQAIAYHSFRHSDLRFEKLARMEKQLGFAARLDRRTPRLIALPGDTEWIDLFSPSPAQLWEQMPGGVDEWGALPVVEIREALAELRRQH